MKNAIGHSPYAVSGKLWRFSSITITKRERKTMTAGNWTYSGTMDHKQSWKTPKRQRILLTLMQKIHLQCRKGALYPIRTSREPKQ